MYIIICEDHFALIFTHNPIVMVVTIVILQILQLVNKGKSGMIQFLNPIANIKVLTHKLSAVWLKG